jgi:hypothetical protein
MNWGIVIMKFIWGAVASILGMIATALIAGSASIPAGTDPFGIVLRYIAVAALTGLVLAIQNLIKHLPK